MRKAMICVGAMLAVLQLWPLMVGHRSVIEVASPGAQAAVVIPLPRRVAAVATLPRPQPAVATLSKTSKPSGCFVRDRATHAACAKGDAACGGEAANARTLCEATGFRPE